MSKKIKYPKITDKVSLFHTAWSELTPDAVFAGMTLSEFDAAVASVKTVRERIESLKALLAAALVERGHADDAARETCVLVINAVRGDPTHGVDSRLYRALGYIPASNRDSGLTRRVSQAASGTDAN